MSKTVEYYLGVLYPNIDSLTEAELKQYKKDELFLTQNLDKVNKQYESAIDMMPEFGESEYVNVLMNVSKKQWDTETRIIEYVDDMVDVLSSDSFIAQNFDYFLDVIKKERAEEERCKDSEIDSSPIDFDTVYNLTEEFLSTIDESGELLNELRALKTENRIKVVKPEGNKNNSKYSYDTGILTYCFNETIADAYTLTHEFMHHIVSIKANPESDRALYSMVSEVISLYYERAFAMFLDQKGMLPNGPDAILDRRAKDEYNKDKNNTLVMLLELCKIRIDKGSIEQDDIIDMLSKYIQDTTDKSELWEQGSNTLMSFINEHALAYEVSDGMCLYRFNMGLALQTDLSNENIKNMYKLAHLVKDKYHDSEFMEAYELQRAKGNKSLSLSEIGDGTIEAFKENPEEADKVVQNIEHMIQAQAITKDEQNQSIGDE